MRMRENRKPKSSPRPATQLDIPHFPFLYKYACEKRETLPSYDNTRLLKGRLSVTQSFSLMRETLHI